jgi:MFS family permease
MSVFFSFGAVIASILGYLILPKWSCPEDLPQPCDMNTQNNGWRIMLFTVSIATIFMLLLRTLWLKLPETPKFLMSQDRHHETIIVLQDIAKINGGHVHIDKDELPCHSTLRRRSSPTEDVTDTEEDHTIVADEEVNRMLLHTGQHGIEDLIVEEKEEKAKALQLLLSPQWRVTTILIWSIWTFTSIAYTMFNVFLPKYLETLGFEGESAPTRSQVYWDYMIYSLAGVPGSVVKYNLLIREQWEILTGLYYRLLLG